MGIIHSNHNHNHESMLSHLLEEALEHIGINSSLSEFFVHLISETLNIFVLLFVIMFIVSFIQTYINYGKLKDKLVKLNNIWAFFLAIGLGTLSPFCSCTIVPVLIGIVNLGVPTIIAISFFTSASLINITAITTMYAATGLNFTILYVIFSLIIILITSLCMSRFNMKDSAKTYSVGHCCHSIEENSIYLHRIHVSLHNIMHVFKGAWLFIIIGVAISSATSVFIPLERIVELANNNFSILVGAIIGLPIHSDVFTILPIILMLKEISIGVTLSFTLATMSISLPTLILLSRAFKVKFILIYTLILFIISIILGYVGMIFL